MPNEYEIKLVERWTFLNEQRNPVDGYRVTFTIPALGITDHVLVAKSAYGPDKVKGLITEQIEQHKELMGL